MRFLGVDLATRRYRDIGIALMEARDRQLAVEWLRWPTLGWVDPPAAAQLVEWLTKLAEREGVTVLALDGPQAWQAPASGLAYARHCEQRLHTQTKTGLPGHTKPGSALRFAEFSIACFDGLAANGWPRLRSPADLQPRAKLALEVYPTAAWRALGLKPLPVKAKTTPAEVRRWWAELHQRLPLLWADSPTHDELQAVVAGLVGLAVAQGQPEHYELHGIPLQQVAATWREGYIVNLRPEISEWRSEIATPEGRPGQRLVI